MSTNDESPETPNGPYTGMSVEALEKAQRVNRINLDAHRGIRDQIKAELKIARAWEASDSKPVPENPGWGSFGFNVQFAGEDGRVWPAVGYQYDAKISVVVGKDYWFFESWDDLIRWMRDTEQVKSVSRIWRLFPVEGGKSVTVR